VRHRSRSAARRAAGSALRAVRLRRVYHPPDFDGPAPEWLSIRP
jgi:hypothetical protein